MVSNDTALVLLQLIALTLPAIGIYMQVVYGNRTPEDDDFDIVTEGVYHQARLAVLSLLFGAIVLLSLLIARQPGDIPIPQKLFADLHSQVSEVNDLILVLSWGLFAILFLLLYFEWLIPKREPFDAIYSVLLILLFVAPIFIASPVSTLAIFPISVGLVIFAGLVGFERGGRQTKQPIRWGLYEFYNHTIGRLRSKYSRGNRFFPPPNAEKASSPDDSSWVAIPKTELPNQGSKDVQSDGERYRIVHIDDAD